jgi:transcriptional regulator with XRE-family HTH domain
LIYRHALGQVIREERLAQTKTLRTISDAGFLSYSFLSEIERGGKDVSSEIFESISKALNIEPHELVVRAGIRMAGLDIPDTAELLLDEYSDLLLRS